jgi:GH24 family phage-related lysozyme (muramidase)
MKLIANWKSVAKSAHSMWAFYASLFCLLLPEIIFWGWGVDTNPRIWWIAGIALLIYGIIGRIWDQGIDRSKTNSPWVVGALAVVLGLALYLGQGTGKGALDLSVATPPQAEIAATTSPSASPDATFLEVAIPFIGRWEGLRLEAYLDIVGVPTVCYGETKGVKLGDSYTKAQCDAMFAREIIAYRDGLRPAFTPETVRARLPVERDVAFTSLACNVGVSGTAKSTAVRRLNQANIAGACEALGWWNKAGGRVVRGLVNRRAEETTLCLSGVA